MSGDASRQLAGWRREKGAERESRVPLLGGGGTLGIQKGGNQKHTRTVHTSDTTLSQSADIKNIKMFTYFHNLQLRCSQVQAIKKTEVENYLFCVKQQRST